MILDGSLHEGGPLPSVRNVAAAYRINPSTFLKGYRQLVEESLVEKRRGLGGADHTLRPRGDDHHADGDDRRRGVYSLVALHGERGDRSIFF